MAHIDPKTSNKLLNIEGQNLYYDSTNLSRTVQNFRIASGGSNRDISLWFAIHIKLLGFHNLDT